MQTSEVTQLTSDRYADFQPRWSPDGSRIAFVTDRGPGTDFQELTYDQMSLAIYDVERGGIQVLTIFDGSKHIDPNFSPDGQTIYFVSDPEGVNDVYSYSLTDGTVRRITDVRTGVSGITEMSPALSVAANTGRMTSRSSKTRGSTSTDSLPIWCRQSRLPQWVRCTDDCRDPPPNSLNQDSFVEAYLRRPTAGLPPALADLDVQEYDPDLSLDFIGPPSIGVGTDRFGGVGFAAPSARTSAIFGRHQLGVAIQTGGSSDTSFQDQIGLQLIYLNQTNRINWGGVPLASRT